MVKRFSLHVPPPSANPPLPPLPPFHAITPMTSFSPTPSLHHTLFPSFPSLSPTLMCYGVNGWKTNGYLHGLRVQISMKIKGYGMEIERERGSDIEREKERERILINRLIRLCMHTMIRICFMQVIQMRNTCLCKCMYVNNYHPPRPHIVIIHKPREILIERKRKREKNNGKVIQK